MTGSDAPPLMLIKGDATDEEVAAVVAVIQAMASATSVPASPPAPVSHWAAPLPRSFDPGRSGAWKASALPR